MSNGGNNHAHFLHEEITIIDGITATLAIKLHEIIEEYNEPQKYGEELAKILGADRNLLAGTLFLNIKNMDGKDALSHQEIKDLLYKRLLHDSEICLNSPALSKVLRKLANDGIFLNITGKRDVKREIPYVTRRKKHSEKPRPQGYYSFYKITDRADKYKKILSDQRAVNLINDRLKNSKMLEPAYKRIAESIWDVVINGNERVGKFFNMNLNAFAPGIQPSDSHWAAFRNGLRSFDNNQLIDLKRDFVDYLLCHPSSHLFLALSLPSFDFT